MRRWILLVVLSLLVNGLAEEPVELKWDYTDTGGTLIYWGGESTFCELCGKPISVWQEGDNGIFYVTNTACYDGPWDGVKSREGGSTWTYRLEHDLCSECRAKVDALIPGRLNALHKELWSGLVAEHEAQKRAHEERRRKQYIEELEVKLREIQAKLEALKN